MDKAIAEGETAGVEEELVKARDKTESVVKEMEVLRAEKQGLEEGWKLATDTAAKEKMDAEEALVALKRQVEAEVRALHQQIEVLENQVSQEAATMES